MNLENSSEHCLTREETVLWYIESHYQGARIPIVLDKRARMNTLAGTYVVFDANYRNDVIVGNDFMNKVGIDSKGSNGTVEWLGNPMPMRAPPTLLQVEEDFNALFESYLVEIEKNGLGLIHLIIMRQKYLTPSMKE